MAEPPYEPPPEEIAEGCRQIQSEWSAETERGRRVHGCQRREWSVPVVSTATTRGNVAGIDALGVVAVPNCIN